MKVIFAPDYSEGNPYQRALADSLSKEGVIVSLGSAYGLFATLKALWAWRKNDVLHLHWQHPFLLDNSRTKTVLQSTIFILGLTILKLFGVKIIWTVHNITSHEGRYLTIELFFCKLLARCCNRIITHTPSAKNLVTHAYGINRSSKVVVIPHGNYIESYDNTVDCTEARHQLGINKGDMVFLYFGHIRPYKGVTELIEAFQKLDVQQSTLLIVGKPQNDGIAEFVLKRCEDDHRISTVFRFISDEEIQIYMNASDIVVLPYKEILMSGTAVLAMSFGKPVIAPRIGCISDILDNEGSFLYDPSDEEGLLKAMQLTYDADLTNMGEHNFQLAKRLNWDDIARKTCRIYEESLGNKR